MDDGGTFRSGLAGGVLMVVLGIAGLALGNGFLGWVALVLGLAGVGAVLGTRYGWITPRARTVRAAPPAPDRTPAADRPVPSLSATGQEQVAGIVSRLHAAGVLVPDAPDPANLHEAVADQGEPVTVDAVLAALHEASYHHPEFRLESCTANLVFHGTQVEQGPEYLREQIDDLVRLAGGALRVEVTGIRQEPTTRIRWTLDGGEQVLTYAGATKYLSTVIHVTLARAMAGAPRRFASLWTDQGMWITALPDDADLSALPGDWEWLADQEPLAAGDVR